MAAPTSRSSRWNRLLLWVWKRLPLSNQGFYILAWLINIRYSVSTSAVIFNERREVLLLHHTYRRASFAWGLPGGYVKGRESLEDALVRELGEETGWAVAIDQLVAVYSGYSLPRVTAIYLAHIVGGEFRPSDEVSDYRYSPTTDLRNMFRDERRAVQQALDLLDAQQAQA
jgi:ADP-ribose pyrophosphatase YjhB (NUDIX family)